MGDALATMTLGTLAGEIWTNIGETDDATRLATLTIVEEVCVWWPVDVMSSIARRRHQEQAGLECLDALGVIGAKCLETIEARYPEPSSSRAIELVLRAIVISFANRWFCGVASRREMRAVIRSVRASRAA